MKHDKGLYIKLPGEMREKAAKHVEKTREVNGLSGLIRRLLAKEIGYRDKE